MILDILTNPYVIMAISLWELVWKGFALWESSQRKNKTIFILLLILNTLGIFPIGYLVYLKYFENPKKD